jgi:hypothetical protein
LELEEDTQEELDELVDLWDALQLRDGAIEDDTTIFDFIEIDEDLAISENPSLDEFARRAIDNQRAAEDVEFDGNEESLSDEAEYFGLL